jgi:CHASE2 domain-containing sensor protein
LIADLKAIARGKILSSVLGAALAALAGLMLWKMPLGEAWINASYDYLFRFEARSITNRVALIMMDNEAYDHFHQTRGEVWDRALHARLLNKLADDGCALVVMDCFFSRARDPAGDEALAKAMRRQHRIALMAEQAKVTHQTLLGMRSLPPAEPFYSAAGTNCGVAWLDPDSDMIVRRMWPFPAPGPYPSLPETAARLEGAPSRQWPQEKWLRYYGQNGAWTRLSYGFALAEPANYFRDQIVFIGTQPKTTILDGETDEFCSPYWRWTHETSGGADIMLTSFLNLVNEEWLRRPDGWIEALILVVTGALAGGGLCRVPLLTACICAAATGVCVTLGAVLCSHFTNYWFPWLLIVGGQLPCALAWAVAVSRARGASAPSVANRPVLAQASLAADSPSIPGYELFPTPFGEGAYGKVWLARNSDGHWRAVKVIYLKNFNNDITPYEREFNGVSRYQPISHKHPSLLRVDFVSKKLPDHFYYVMELGDALDPGWEREPRTYKPHDLASECARAPRGRLSASECLRIGIELSDALDFLHRQGLTHRDIKPQNIIFVNGRPKLADLGLISEIRPPDQPRTLVGTPGYMPPPPEHPGTPQADIYALGVVLYVLSTGRHAAFFPEVSTTLAENLDAEEFFTVNTVILNACQPDPAQRYASALEMRVALQKAQESIVIDSKGNPPRAV